MAHRILNPRYGLLAAFIALLGVAAGSGEAYGQRKVEDVVFHGNEAFPAERLADVTRVENRNILQFLGKGRPTFNYLVMGRDTTILRAFYRNRGYLQCSVEDRVEPLGEERLVVHYTIREGPRYTLSELRFEGNEVFGDEALRGLLSGLRGYRLRQGAPISESALQAGAERIRQLYLEEGYYFVEVSPRIGQRDTTSGAAPVTYRVREGNQVRVTDVTVEGARHSKDFVITREVTLDPGDLLKETQRRESQRRLYGTGIFRTANVTVGGVNEDTTSVNVLVTVRERPLHYFGFGAGVAGDDREQLDLNLHTSSDWGHRNLFGTGRVLELRASADFQVVTAWELVRRELSMRYVEPWLLGTRMPGTLTLALRPQSYGIYNVQEITAEIGLSREFTPRSRGRLDFTYRLVDTEVPVEAFSSRDALRGGSLWAERDSRDNFFSPVSGSYTQAMVRGYGGKVLGGPSYAIMSATWSRYQLTGSSTVLATRVRAGLAQPYGGTDEVLIFDRFFAGGANSVRGYSERRLGPVTTSVDTTTGRTSFQARGGRALLLLNAEMRRPGILGPVGSMVFVDAGNVWARTGDVGFDLALTAGVGIFLDTPIGPFRVNYGWRLNKSPTERATPGFSLPPGQFHFTVLHAF
ncbi:MAG: BamA/TamA family outer membrane protein [bacterium]